MRRSRATRPAVLLVLAMVLLSPRAREVEAQAGAPSLRADTSLYVVADYDPARNPAADLARATERARASSKRLLLEVGGAWCTWCHALYHYLRDDQVVAQALREHFLILKVNFSEENQNEAFLSRYPEIPGYPHLYVLDADGTFLHSQRTDVLEFRSTYSQEAWLAFIERWAPAP